MFTHMQDENVLLNELLKIDGNSFKRLLSIWNIKKIPKDKKGQIKELMNAMEDEFYVKNILEKLSSLQNAIYFEIINSPELMLTLGAITKKFNIPPNTAEIELGVLKRYFLIYQRKNRERLTNTLDRYYAYPQSAKTVQYELNRNNEKFKTSLVNVLNDRRKTKPSLLEKIWLESTEKNINDVLQELFQNLSDIEEELILMAFQQGGILDINIARETIEKNKLKWEDIIIKLNKQLLLIDDYYIDEKFIRLLIMPVEVFQYIVDNPIVPKTPAGVKKSLEKVVKNDLDFFINIKKLISYILKRGINLSKSGKLKQTDLRDTENFLLHVDIELFKEKSQIYQIELLLCIMRVLDIVRIKKDDVVLRNNWEEYLSLEPQEILKRTLKNIEELEDKYIRFEDIFDPVYVPYYKKKILQSVVKALLKQEKKIYYVIMGILVRENLILDKNFKIKDFPDQYVNYQKELVSTLFYLQLFGLLVVEYPDRWISFSEFGLYIFKKQPLRKDTIHKGEIIVNTDLTIIAFPEKISYYGLALLKLFCELKSFENIYTFQFTRESFYSALLIQQDVQKFLKYLEQASVSDLPQNLIFSINDWKNNIPLISITDECVVVKTREPAHMELLLGQITSRDVVIEHLGPNTIIIEQDKIYEVIEIAERLNLLVKLIK